MSNLMGKFGTFRDTYEEQGMAGVGSELKDYFITGGAARYTKKLLGKRYFIRLYTYNRLGYWPHLKNPRTFNEKIQHRKLYTDNDLFSIVEDKWRVREYVEGRVGNDILPEVYHVTEDPETIPFEELPDEYVVKPNHLSGGANYIVYGNSPPDTRSIVETCKGWLQKANGQLKEEYWYWKITPKVIVEEYIKSDLYVAPIDYKFMVFHGEVKIIHVTYNRFDKGKTKRNFYDTDWNPIDVKLYFEQGDGIPRPPNLAEMIEIAETLGDEFKHIRVDLYNPSEEDIYFGEMTVAESSGGNPFVPQEYDFKLGSYW